MNVNIPRARRFPRRPIEQPFDWQAYIDWVRANWVEVRLPPNPLANEQFAIAD